MLLFIRAKTWCEKWRFGVSDAACNIVQLCYAVFFRFLGRRPLSQSHDRGLEEAKKVNRTNIPACAYYPLFQSPAKNTMTYRKTFHVMKTTYLYWEGCRYVCCLPYYKDYIPLLGRLSRRLLLTLMRTSPHLTLLATPAAAIWRRAPSDVSPVTSHHPDTREHTAPAPLKSEVPTEHKLTKK